MASLLDPREVYQYLQELGYKNITPQQLKEFLKDLKKLIKHDERIQYVHRIQTRENHPPENTDIFENLYVSKTVASKAKEVPKKEKIICVQIKKHKDTCRHKKTAEEVQQTDPEERVIGVHDDFSNVSVGKSTSPQINMSEKSIAGTSQERIQANTESSKQLTSRTSQHSSLKPKASFIRPKSYTRICKSDPVALYHQYQAEWRRQKEKIPGETNHSSLRWVIREKMLG